MMEKYATKHLSVAGLMAGSLLILTSGVADAQSITACPFTWNTTLKVGSVGVGVLHLQALLNADPATMIASVGSGSPGHETNRFGPSTQAAVIKFQQKYAADILKPVGLSIPNGLVGPATRAKLNALCAAPVSTATTTAPVSATIATPSLTITTPDQPPHTLAPQGALYIPFTNATLTAGSTDVHVKSVTVERVGPSSDDTIDTVELFNGDSSGISYARLHSDHRITLPANFVIPAGTSKSIIIAGDMASDLSAHDGELIGLSIVAVDADAPIAGGLPVRGTLQTANSTLTIGTATALLSQYDPDVEQRRYINDAGVRFSGIRITAGSMEDVTLNSITWDQTGTASSNDLSNVVTVANGTSYTAVPDGHSYTSTFPNGIVIPKGNSVDVYVQGDLGITGANRTAKFDIRLPTDVDISGNTYGFGIYLTPSGNTDVAGATSAFITSDGTTDGTISTPFFSGSITDISGGALISVGR